MLRAIGIWLDRTRGKSANKLELGAKGDFDDNENPISTVLEQLLAKGKRNEAEENTEDPEV